MGCVTVTGVCICGKDAVAKGKCSICYLKNWRKKNPEYMKKYCLEKKHMIRERQKKYKKDHRKYFREKQKCYREQHPEKVTESKQKYYQKNKEKIKEGEKSYYKNNKECVKKSVKKWCAKNPDKVRLYNVRKKSRRKEKFGSIVLMNNPFPDDIPINWHHLKNCLYDPNTYLTFIFPIPSQTHLYVNGSISDNEHWKYNGTWIKKLFCIDIGKFLSGEQDFMYYDIRQNKEEIDWR